MWTELVTGSQGRESKLTVVVSTTVALPQHIPIKYIVIICDYFLIWSEQESS